MTRFFRSAWKSAPGPGIVFLLLGMGACGSDPAAPEDGPEIFFDAVFTVQEVGTDTLSIRVTTPDQKPITLGLVSGPGFARLEDHGGGSATLAVMPQIGDQGNHSFVVSATSGGATSTRTGTIVVGGITPATGGLFFEPICFCVVDNQVNKTLTLFNRSSESLVWQPVFGPPEAIELLSRRTVAPANLLDVKWSWLPSGPYPVEDSLVVHTNDPDRPRVVIPLRREDPAGFSDITPPAAPVLAAPGDGAVFTLVLDPLTMIKEVEIPLAWSTLDDCSGIDHYTIEISRSPNFAPVDFAADVPIAGAIVIAELADVGVSYWRVFSVDGVGLTGIPSPPRSWTILDAAP